MRIEKRSAIITAGVLALIVYGSLFPFRFHAALPFSSLLRLFLASVNERVSRGDLISNVLLYLPLGFFAVRAFPDRAPAKRVILATAAAAILSTAIEITQFYDSDRGPSLWDAFGNTLGTLIGAIAGISLVRGLSFPILLLLAWTGDCLLPFLPSLHFHKYIEAVGPLYNRPQIQPLHAFNHFALWLAAAALLEWLAGTARSRWMLPLFLAFIVAGRIVIYDLEVTPAEVVGGGLAVLAWMILSRVRWRTRAVTAIFVVFVALEALRPFHFLAAPRAFTWIPFLGFIEGSREAACIVFLEKTYIYGCLVWLLARSGFSYVVTAISAASFVLCLRMIQVYLPERSAEIGDTVMVLILAGVMSLLEPQPPARPRPYPPSSAATIPR